MNPESTFGAQHRLPLHSGDIFLMYIHQLRSQASWFEDELLFREMHKDYEWNFDIEALHRKNYDAIALTNPLGSVEWVDAGFERINGCTLAEIMGADLFSFLGVRDHASPRTRSTAKGEEDNGCYEGMGIDRLGRIRQWRIERFKLFNQQEEFTHILTLQRELFT
ncbi:MAG: hypothetical protein AAGA85_25210 [Bacteroidota bacterium]